MIIKQGVGKQFDLDCIGKISRQPKYNLLVKNAGSYSENSLFKLGVNLLLHRFHHLCHGQGWKD